MSLVIMEVAIVLDKDNEGRININQFRLPSKVSHGLEKMGLGDEMRELKRGLQRKTRAQRNVQLLCPPTKKLVDAFQSVSPKLSPKLSGDVIARFWSSLLYAATLSENLRKIIHINGNGRSGRKELRSILAVIYEADLRGLRRQVEGLRRDIPRLIRELGGDPSEELLLPRRSARQR
jgi:hypothetical protein